MEKWKVVGYRKVDFKDQDGRPVKGYTLFLARQSDDEYITGLEVQKIFISSERVAYVPAENDYVGLSYNRYGKVQDIEVLQKGA